jgi:hypothetical protein
VLRLRRINEEKEVVSVPLKPQHVSLVAMGGPYELFLEIKGLVMAGEAHGWASGSPLVLQGWSE